MQSPHLQAQLDRDKGHQRRVRWDARNRDIRRLALAGISAGAARLVNRDGDDLQDRSQTYESAIASSTAHVRKQVITHGLHDVIGEDDRMSLLGCEWTRE